MPISVEMPTLLRVDYSALIDHRDVLEDALVAAFRRAFAGAREQVIEPRGGYRGIRLEKPRFRWTGDAVDVLTEGDRARFEAWFDRMLLQTADESALFDLAREAEKAPPLLPADIWELADPESDIADLDLYLLPIYDDQGKKRPIPKKGTRVKRDGDFEIIQALRWQTPKTPEQFAEAVRKRTKARKIPLPSAGQFGYIMKLSKGYGIAVSQRETHKWLVRLELEAPSTPQIGKDKTLKMVKETLPTVESGARLKWFAAGATETERIDAVSKAYGPGLRVQMLAKSKRAALASEREIKAQSDAIVDEYVAEIAKKTSACNFLELALGGRTWLITIPPSVYTADVLQKIDTELLPLVEWQEVQRTRVGEPGDGGREKRGEGKKKGAGKGAGGKGVGGAGEAGEGDEEGDEQEPGGDAVIYTGEDEQKKDGAGLFPTTYFDLSSPEMACSPFLEEPDLSALGAEGERIRAKIVEIARMLRIQPCEYAGRFAIEASETVASRAVTVGNFAVHTQESAFTQPVSATEVTLKRLTFVPTSSPAVQFMRHLARAVAALDELDGMIREAMWANSKLIDGMYKGNGVGWFLHYRFDFADNMKLAASWIFIVTCRVLLLQLLHASAKSIKQRIDNFNVYAPIFEQLARTQLLAIDELMALRSHLQSATESFGAAAVVRVASETWAEVRMEMVGLYESAAGRTAPELNATPFELVRDSTGKAVAINDSTGKAWTMVQLEQAIAIRRGSAEAIDPLVKQLTEIPAVAARMRANPAFLREELWRLLHEMKSSNDSQTSEVFGSAMYAFRASKIHELDDGSRHTIANAPFEMVGIHLMAHGEIAEFFSGSLWYAEGVKALFNSELGLKGFGTFFEFTGLILLGVLCPPAAFLVGAAVASYHYAVALESLELYRALINPDEILSMAEIEVELFAAQLGLALSFVPEAGTILRLGGRVASTAARRGIRQGAKLALRAVRYRIYKDMAHSLARGVEYAFIRELASDRLITAVAEKLLGPVTDAIEREEMVTGSVGGKKGMLAVIEMLEREQLALAGAGYAVEH